MNYYKKVPQKPFKRDQTRRSQYQRFFLFIILNQTSTITYIINQKTI